MGDCCVCVGVTEKISLSPGVPLHSGHVKASPGPAAATSICGPWVEILGLWFIFYHVLLFEKTQVLLSCPGRHCLPVHSSPSLVEGGFLSSLLKENHRHRRSPLQCSGQPGKYFQGLFHATLLEHHERVTMVTLVLKRGDMETEVQEGWIISKEFTVKGRAGVWKCFPESVVLVIKLSPSNVTQNAVLTYMAFIVTVAHCSMCLS